MFFPLHILRRHVVWIISAKRSYTISDKFSLVDHSNTCLEAVRAEIDASKTVHTSITNFGEFISAMLFVTRLWLPHAGTFYLVAALLLVRGRSAFHIASSRMPHFCENLRHEHPSEAGSVHYGIHFVPIHIHACLEGAIRNFIKRNHCIMLGCVGGFSVAMLQFRWALFGPAIAFTVRTQTRNNSITTAS